MSRLFRVPRQVPVMKNAGAGSDRSPRRRPRFRGPRRASR